MQDCDNLQDAVDKMGQNEKQPREVRCPKCSKNSAFCAQIWEQVGEVVQFDLKFPSQNELDMRTKKHEVQVPEMAAFCEA